MKYSKPWIKIQKFDIIEDIATEGVSAVTTTTSPDDDNNDPDYEIIPTNRFNLGQ